MKNLSFFILLLFNLTLVAQNTFDHVITKDSDSIACYIDSINESVIYLQLKSEGKWKRTSFQRSQVISYEKNAIRRKNVYFKRRSSIIIAERQQSRSLQNIQKNSIIFSNDYIWSLTASFQRIQPISNHMGIIGRAGFGITGESGLDPVSDGEISFIAGKFRNFGELGIGYYVPFTHKSGPVFIPNISYRYIGFKGLMIKAGFGLHIYTLQSEIDEWGQFEKTPILQIGYLLRL